MSKGPPPGFSKGVNDSLIIASNLLHLKASALLGFALTLAGIVVSHAPAGAPARAFHFAGVLLLAAAACFAGAVIYPIKHSRRGGQLFWGDIITHHDPKTYADSLAGLDAAAADREYAYTNFRLSEVLAAKYGLVRWAVLMLLVGAALAAAGRILG